MRRPDETDEMILKLFVSLVDAADGGMRAQINHILHLTKGRYVGIDQDGNVEVGDSAPELRKRWGHDS